MTQNFYKYKSRNSLSLQKKSNIKLTQLTNICLHNNNLGMKIRSTVMSPQRNYWQPKGSVKRQTRKSLKKSCQGSNIMKKNSLIQSQNNSPNRLSMHNYNNHDNKFKLKMSYLKTLPLQQYKFIYPIGLGGLGKVWKIQEISTDQAYAMKIMLKQKVIATNSLHSILNQRIILSHLNHPFLVNIKKSFQDQQNLYLTMEYLRGADLRYHICYKQKFTQIQTKFIIACVIVSLEYIHNQGFIHRDIKPQNIIFQEGGYLRVTDFGIAQQRKVQIDHQGQPSGTPGYMAPQVILIFFSLGVVAHELMFRRRPYIGQNRNQIRQNMKSQPAKINKLDIPQGWSDQSVQFILKLLQRNPLKRLGSRGISQLKQHSWMQSIKWKKLELKKLTPPFIPYAICQTRQYLSQIQSYSKIQQLKMQNNQNIPILQKYQRLFLFYDFQKTSIYNNKQKNISNKKNTKILFRV